MPGMCRQAAVRRPLHPDGPGHLWGQDATGQALEPEQPRAERGVKLRPHQVVCVFQLYIGVIISRARRSCLGAHVGRARANVEKREGRTSPSTARGSRGRKEEIVWVNTGRQGSSQEVRKCRRGVGLNLKMREVKQRSSHAQISQLGASQQHLEVDLLHPATQTSTS